MPVQLALTPADIIATCAVLVAAFAMVATIWQGVIARRHSRLSVRPLLDWHDVRQSPSRLGLTIENRGLGPAIVSKVKLVVDGKAFDQHGDGYRKFVAEHVHARGGKGDFQVLTAGTSLPVGERLDLFMLTVPENESARLQSIVRFLDEVEFEIEYQSMYGERYFIIRRQTGDA